MPPPSSSSSSSSSSSLSLALILSVAAVAAVTATTLTYTYTHYTHNKRRKRRSSCSSSFSPHSLQVSIIGDTFCDVIVGGLDTLPSWGADALCSRPIELAVGGSACNTSLQLAYLLRNIHSDPPPAHIVLHTALGPANDEGDFFAGFIRQKIKAAVSSSSSSSSSSSTATTDILHLSTPPAPPPPKTTHPQKPSQKSGVCICLSGHADRAFVTYRGVVDSFSKDQLDLPLLLQSQIVHIAGFYNCPSLWPDLPELLHQCQHTHTHTHTKKGIFTSLSPQYDATGTWEGLDPLFPYLDLFLPNEMEALAISEKQTVEEAAIYFIQKGVKHVVITLGGEGVYALVEGGKREIKQACPRKEVVDTTGCGDAFVAGLLYSLVLGMSIDNENEEETDGKDREISWKDALRWGCAVGAHTVTKMGASAPPRDREEILENLEAM